MCGIYGVLDLDGAPVDAAVLRPHGATHGASWPRRRGHARRRAACAIGMRRLSIIDVAGGHQPLRNEDGSLVARRQRRDLQLPRAARRARRRRPSVPDRLGLRNDPAPVRGVRRRLRRAPQRHVRVRACGTRSGGACSSAATGSASSRCTSANDGKRLIFASEAKALLAAPGVHAGARSRGARARTSRSATFPRRSRSSGHPQAAAGDRCWSSRTAGSTERLLLAASRPRSIACAAERDWIGARARAPRDVGAHADGERRAHRRVPVRRRRLERGGRVHGARTATSPVKTYAIGFEGGAGRVVLQRAAVRAAGGAAIRDRSPRDHRQARRRVAAAAAALAHGRADRRHGVHHDLPRLRVRAARRHRHPVRRRAATSSSAATGAISATTTVVLRPRCRAPMRRAALALARRGCRATAIRRCSNAMRLARGFLASARIVVRGALSLLRRGVRTRCRADSLLRAPAPAADDALADAFATTRGADELNRMLGGRCRDAAARRPAAADRQDEHGGVARVPRAAARPRARASSPRACRTASRSAADG